ncbi:serine/threonine protein kinase [Brevibacterium luteolum]|uniref:serine/threonine protein kinase n=1 Tax=Brevibacterium luteolum TaxID=199591 RepID=UPI00223C4A4D|nr:serine/threonine-protein kinase [Brevibacterium luteolum]MCT1921936.1 serine/threonine protein kinase [Brevibacterium luteolum]
MSDTIAGRFTLLDPIASGGSGTVWIARDERFGNLCAAKVLRQRDSGDLLRFVRENTVRLNHPHVLAPYAWAAEDAHVVIAMPLVTGGTLADILRSGRRFSAAATAEAVRQILDGLTAVHAAGWIHRDIKPANIMIDAEQPDLHLLLADFGIAVDTNAPRLTQSGIVHGTPGFVAPEIMMGGDISPAQDVWATGQIGKRMLGMDDDAVAEAVRASADPLTQGLVHLLDDLTAADARKRPSPEIAAAALSRLGLRGPFHFADGTPWHPQREIASPALPQNPAPTLILVPQADQTQVDFRRSPSGGPPQPGSQPGGQPAAQAAHAAPVLGSGPAPGFAPTQVDQVRPDRGERKPAKGLAASAAVFAFIGALLILVGIFAPGYLG